MTRGHDFTPRTRPHSHTFSKLLGLLCPAPTVCCKCLRRRLPGRFFPSGIPEPCCPFEPRRRLRSAAGCSGIRSSVSLLQVGLCSQWSELTVRTCPANELLRHFHRSDHALPWYGAQMGRPSSVGLFGAPGSVATLGERCLLSRPCLTYALEGGIQGKLELSLWGSYSGNGFEAAVGTAVSTWTKLLQSTAYIVCVYIYIYLYLHLY